MSYETKFENWKEMVIEATAQSESAAKAALLLGIKYDTYKKYAVKYGCFNTNQSGKGTKKYTPSIPLDLILSGKHPTYSTDKLKKRLLKEKILDEKCTFCGISNVWNDRPLILQLDHINGDGRDHRLENLRILCPNCHSQTETWCNRKV